MRGMAAEDESHRHCLSCIHGFACRLSDHCPVQRCPNGCGAITHECKIADHVLEVCVLAKVACPNQLYGCPKKLQRRHLGLHLRSCPANVIRCMCTKMRPTDSDHAHGVTVATGPYAPQPCGEFVRRDTFAEHMREHMDVQPALDGWFEARCPLAAQGCPFVYRRWRPHAPRTVLRFNADLDALVTTCEPGEKEEAAEAEDGASRLLALPPELLLHICSMLDGLSLTSLSRTCSALRQVTAMLLASKGCVTRHWRRQGDGRWALEDARHWRLNRSMEPIRRWAFTEEGLSALQRHLRDCSFNLPEPFSAEPVRVMLEAVAARNG